MDSAVICDVKEFKVRQSIVGAIVVSMMDVFLCAKRSAKVSRHDRTMFQHVLACDSDGDVAI